MNAEARDASADVTPERVTFTANGEEVVGYLYLPRNESPPHACLVMGHGFCGTQGLLTAHAGDFVGAGIAVLTFDYRSFGESGGSPRQIIDIKGQREDWRAAIGYARSRHEIDADRIGLWGSSLGGTHTIFIAADDPKVAAVVAQIPYAGPPKESVGRTKAQVRKIMWLALKDRLRGMLGRSPLYVEAIGSADEGAILVDPHAMTVVESLDPEHARTWKNQVAPRIVFDLLGVKPVKVAHKVAAPLLVTIAEGDTEAPIYLTRELARRAPRGEADEYPTTHYEMYQPQWRQKARARQIEFLRKHLLGITEPLSTAG
ncbi:MAG TPA: alpha/beta fold hydrolase [Acidimicrobiales bacterium]|nr:alpha/beta fold hydrolase [Acidimicrobiales bacterium]